MASDPNTKRTILPFADVNVTLIQEILGGEEYYSLEFSGNEKHFSFVKGEILWAIDTVGYDARMMKENNNQIMFSSYGEASSDYRRTHQKLDPRVITSVIKNLNEIYPGADLIDLAMRQRKARNVQHLDQQDMAQRLKTAQDILGDTERLTQFITEAFEGAGDDIYIGGRVNFDLDSKIGKKFAKDLAEMLVVRAAESPVLDPRKRGLG